MRGFLISESKKSEAAEKLNRTLPFLEKYTDKILDLDPTGYKYVGWIANNLIDYFKGKNEVSSEDWIYLNNFLGSINSFHNNQQYIDKEVLKRFKNALTWANDEVANKNVDKIYSSPKDINSFDFVTLKIFTDTLNKYVNEKKTYKQVKKGVNKIYDDGRFLVVEPETHESSCFYGKNTKWCTTSEKSDYFDKYTKQGRLFYFLDKKNEFQKMAAYIPNTGYNEYYNAADQGVTKADLLKFYPFADEILTDVKPSAKVLKSLQEFQNSEKNYYDKQNLNNADSLFHRVDDDSIILHFDGVSDFWNLFDMDEYDKFIVQSYDSPYFEVMDSSTIYDEWNEGYNLNYFSIEQRNKTIELLEILAPSLHNCLKEWKENRVGGDDCGSKISSYLEMIEPRSVENINDAIFEDRMGALREGIGEYLDEDFSNPLSEYGLNIENNSFTSARIKIDNLIDFYNKHDPDGQSDTFSLMKQVVEKEQIDGPNLSDRIYELESPNYNFYNTENMINNLIENLEESVDQMVGPKFDESLSFIDSIGGLQTIIQAPFSKEYKIFVNEIDPQTGNISFRISNISNVKSLRLPLQNFKEFLYNQKLFDL